MAALAPALPNPWMATAAPSMFSPVAPSASCSTSNPPCAVAVSRPADPPCARLLPVTTAGEMVRLCRPYSWAIQSMVCELVLTSGAGMSTCGPITRQMRSVYERVRASSSVLESVLGSTVIPPLPPPSGMSTTAVLMLIQAASALTSSRLTFA